MLHALCQVKAERRAGEDTALTMWLVAALGGIPRET
jgi:hypothetical protein